MNQTNTHQTKTNPCFIGIDVLPRLKRRDEILRKQKQARRLYWIQNLYTLMFAIFTVFTVIGVIGGIQMASLGLHSLATTFLFVGVGATFLMFGALYSIRQVARLLPSPDLTQGELTIKVSAFERGQLLVREYPDVKDTTTIGTAVKKALRWKDLIDLNVDFLWSHGDDRAVVNLKIVG